MNKLFEILPKIFEINKPASIESIENAEKHFKAKLPRDYKDFLLFSNGIEGIIKDSYLVIWSIEELIELNEAYHVKEFVKDIIIFGSDGAEEAFGFEYTRNMIIITKLPFIGMGLTTSEFLKYTFDEFIISQLNQN